MLRHTVWGMGLLAMATAYSGCGKQTLSDGEPLPPEGEKPVRGTTYFGSQCTLGTLPDAIPTKMSAADCDITTEYMELSQGPSGFLFQADCKKQLITVRSKTGDGKIDGQFKLRPNGTVDLGLTDATVGSVGIKGAAGAAGCTAFPTLDMTFTVDCKDIDHALIQVDTSWNLSKGKAPLTFTGSVCKLPAACALHSSAIVKQCP